MSTKEIARQVYTVNEFCEAHRISRSMFYVLRQQGKGPKVMKVGRKTLITEEAAKQWRTRLEG